MSIDWEVAVDGLAFPEGLRWHDGQLYFSDIFGRTVHRLGEDGACETVADVPGLPSGLGFRPDGTLLIVSMADRTVLSVEPGGTSVMADLSAFASGNCNDMLVDPVGRAYVGNFGYDLIGGAEPAPAELVMVDVDGSVRQVADGLWFPNGMVLSLDRSTLFVAETSAERITAFTVDERGDLSERREFIAVPGLRPDGLSIDAEDAVWAALPRAGQMVRVDRNGEITDRLEAPGGTTCVLGGADGRILYVVCAPTAEEEVAVRDRPASIRTVRVDVPAPGGDRRRPR